MELNTNSMGNPKPQNASEGTPQYQYCAVKGHGAACKQLDTRIDACGEEVQTPCGRVSDTHLASRRAMEAAERRYQAVSWLQEMVGPLNLSTEPSEEEFRAFLQNGIVLCNLINKIHPGAVPKIVENAALIAPAEGVPLSAFQYFENVRNFLVAVEEMKLLSFDASDLEKGGSLGSSTKIVDCILSIKAYHEWQQAGGQGFWKLGATFKTPSSSKTPLSRPRLACSWLGSGRSSDAFSLSISKATGRNMSEEYENLVEKLGMPLESCSLEFMKETLNACSNFDATLAWVQRVCKKFVETFMAKKKNAEQTSVLGVSDTNMQCEALLKLVLAVLQDKNPEEVAALVECMLKEIIEEFGQRALCLEGQGSSKVSNGCQEVHDAKASNQNDTLKLELQNNELKEMKCVLESTKLHFQNFKCGWEEEMKALGVKMHGLTQAAAEYPKVAAENRELYNQVQDLKGNIRVYCRVRPFLPGQGSGRSTVDFVGDKGSIVIVNPTKQGKEHRKSFTFNKVFGPSASQEEVFLDTQPLIRSVLDGYNVCIFAYGQTGSGKTYTMTGPNNPSPTDWGVNFRALHDLFKISEQRQDLINYEVGVQMMEIYNEQVRDLLCTDGLSKKLEIRNNSQQNGLNVPDANLLPVKSIDDVLELMTLGHKNRSVGATAMNERSSRSHSVLTVHVKGIDVRSRDVLRGCLHLVDLAGSERVDKSEVTGDRLREAQHINKSLAALGDVIAALAQKSPHVPYRNSKLTQLLQDSLGGQAKTLMFVHVSPDEESHGETISTLKFAERVATVELGAAHSNKESGEIKDLKDQVALLRDALSRKEGELERYQKEAKTKSTEFLQDKQRVKVGISPLHPGHGVQRSPLEELGNTQVGYDPSQGIPTSNMQMMSLSHQGSPLWNTATGPKYSVGLDEDCLKRRAHQQPSPSPSMGITSTRQAGNDGSAKKNKFRHGYCDELQPHIKRASLEPAQSSPKQDYASDGVERTFQGGLDNHSNLSPLLLQHTPSKKPLHIRSSQPVVFFARERSESEKSCSTQEATERRVDCMGEEEQIMSDDYSEADSGQVTRSYGFSHSQEPKASIGKRRKDTDKRLGDQHQVRHIAKRPTTTALPKENRQANLTLLGTEAARRIGGKGNIAQPKVKASRKPI